MNITDLTNLLQQPQNIKASQISDVRSIVDEFPYFQSARALYLKGLKTEESFKYNQELKITAAYTTDRSVLFDFITSEEFKQNKISEHIKRNIENLKDIEVNAIEDISVNKSVIIDDALRQHIKAVEPALNPELFQAKDLITNDFTLDTSLIEEKPSPEEIFEADKPLDFNKGEVHSFSEWLKITSFKPIIRNEDDYQKEGFQEKTVVSNTDKFKLIDKFIQNNPKRLPVKKDVNKRNIAKAQMIKPKSLMTETLARIYVEQKNYEKAIKSYKILSLKYPEKSGFFADQIKTVKELQKNNK